MQKLPRYIVVEGPIGVGKTSLARKLADTLGADLILEQADENPFLQRFYKEPRSAALPTQLFFLCQRASQVQAMRQADMFQPVRVADYLLQKDNIFARLTLDEDEYQLYAQVYEKFAVDAPEPDLVIYLQAPVNVLMERILRRGVEYERLIEPSYLERVNEAYTRFFFDYDESPLLIVNTVDVDFEQRDEDYQELFDRIQSIKRGRHYYNPISTALL